MTKVFKAYLIDVLILLALITPVCIWFYIEIMTVEEARLFLNSEPIHSKQDTYAFLMSIYMTAIGAYLLLKDVLNISVGKRIYHLTLVERKNGMETIWIKKIARNLTLFFPPTLLLEIIMKLITPKSRFGEMILDIENNDDK